jgi:tetratricopeptide (TPR) repeat protein
MAELARDVEISAQPPQVLVRVSEILMVNGRPDDAVRLLRRVQVAYPNDFWVNSTLGSELSMTQPDEALRFLTVAVALRPRSPGAWLNLGICLSRNGRVDEAIPILQKAIEVKRDYASAHIELGRALWDRGRFDEASEVFRKLLALPSGSAATHLARGTALQYMGDLPAAAAEYRAAAAGANMAEAHQNLGNILYDLGDHPGAIASYQRALKIDRNYAKAYCNLGSTLILEGKFAAALEAFQTGHKIGSRWKNWPYDTPRFIKRCERFLHLERQLPQFLTGEARPASTGERLYLAQLCYYKRLHAASARFYREAFETDAKLAADMRPYHRYHAGSAAAQAGCGEGEDAAAVPAKARASLRKQALEWLRGSLAVWESRLRNAGKPPDWAAVQAALHTWRSDPALAGVRDDGSLAALPAAERAAWQQLWADVAALMTSSRKPLGW